MFCENNKNNCFCCCKMNYITHRFYTLLQTELFCLQQENQSFIQQSSKVFLSVLNISEMVGLIR